MCSQQRGFTMIELVVAMAIVGILAAIAYPSYINYMERSRRTEGRELLARVAAAQERFYTTRNEYTEDVTTAAGLNLVTALSEGGHYVVEVEVGDDGQTYLLSAVPQEPQDKDKCGTLSVDNVGVRGYTGNENNGRCW